MKIIAMSRKKGRKNSSCLSGKRRLWWEWQLDKTDVCTFYGERIILTMGMDPLRWRSATARWNKSIP